MNKDIPFGLIGACLGGVLGYFILKWTGDVWYAPIFPGATGVTSYRLETMKAMTYSSGATPAELKSFYRETLKALGFAEQEELSFTKGGQRLTVTVAPGITERFVMVQVQAGR